jgi:hypothetical protein
VHQRITGMKRLDSLAFPSPPSYIYFCSLFRMAVASKNGIPPFGPVLRSSFSSLDKSKFRDVLFTKSMFSVLLPPPPYIYSFSFLFFSFFFFLFFLFFFAVCNAEMAALDSPVFEEKMTRTRMALLTSVVKKFLKPDELHKKPLKKSPSTATLFNSDQKKDKS